VNRPALVAFDSAKEKHVADDGRDGEVRYLGEIDNSPDAVRKLVAKLAPAILLRGWTDRHGLHRQLTDLGHLCDVIAPTMIPERSGDRQAPARWGTARDPGAG
jgi:transposase